MEVENFNNIYQLYYNKVYRLCKGYFNGDIEIANDATQEVFMKVWENLATFRDESSMGTWIYRIASNTCLMYLRKETNKKELRLNELPDVLSESDANEIEDKLKKMYNCISQLEPSNKLIIMMVLENLSYQDIAAIIGITEDNLRVKIHRIKAKLTNCVQNGKF
ncbi:MAG: sigma-70 family RNA polymerase sigma factor [Microscillaceae bacterium]|jgi:RNA polymerase sigma-70 factor (ECF subfamily)|nr:sigma-70 family RNA polymerase sigma factor [Microscillaceae bacterium]